MQLVPDHDPDNDDELASLRTGFPQFRIWRESYRDRTRYVARSLHPGTRPHTIVTADPRELWAELGVTPRQARPEREWAFDARMPNIARVGWLVGLEPVGDPGLRSAPDRGGRPGQRELRRVGGPGRPLRRVAAGRRGPTRGDHAQLSDRAGSSGDDAHHRRESPDDVQRWREAARLRHEHPGWIVLWLARIGQYRAYRLRGRRDTVLTAPTPVDLVAQIGQSEQEAPGRLPRPRRPT